MFGAIFVILGIAGLAFSAFMVKFWLWAGAELAIALSLEPIFGIIFSVLFLISLSITWLVPAVYSIIGIVFGVLEVLD